MDVAYLCTELDLKFENNTLSETYQKNLQNIGKSSNETYPKYASRIAEMTSKAHTGINIDLFNRLCVEYLLNGITDQNMVYDIMTNRPQSKNKVIN